MHISLFINAIYWIQMSFEKIYFILFYLQSYFFEEQSKFLLLN